MRKEAGSYKELLQGLKDEAGPDTETLNQLGQQVRVILDAMSDDLQAYAFRRKEEVHDLLKAKFWEDWYDDRIQYYHGKPSPETLKLGYVVLGKVPGSYEVWVEYKRDGISVYFAWIYSNLPNIAQPRPSP
ncbi:hypothetical protein A3A84_03515 [Candidatus Collierbacteria bacterium RIFCSPLOWO2_01_FULL_50_23]|uniref:Uncharacterized protein n=2 Tax=Candidatus Collieribacteriota TaxID=1752725 RepID=A0A1F5ETE8_9BACT|nr:MAG: hypothetical protein A3D09_00065 [Candidatus Collierbacteria bacterium RIFCSPHIGHO2_02_FULL_49_10]OGD72076.1 MAG: hypothetical protein A2703_03825 [Candidatus Collierbacteria bacterium RIFCSPHIGHO2_01_FULL_50_25]OGD75223.1 MAG: hypothetical protein A3A84_03515 [Candidatus Collierbacteria bacterium RIFCSPLOWO2_01_FULL_50_23]